MLHKNLAMSNTKFRNGMVTSLAVFSIVRFLFYCTIFNLIEQWWGSTTFYVNWQQIFMFYSAIWMNIWSFTGPVSRLGWMNTLLILIMNSPSRSTARSQVGSAVIRVICPRRQWGSWGWGAQAATASGWGGKRGWIGKWRAGFFRLVSHFDFCISIYILKLLNLNGLHFVILLIE